MGSGQMHNWCSNIKYKPKVGVWTDIEDLPGPKRLASWDGILYVMVLIIASIVTTK